MITIGLASDHAGFELKEFVKNYLEQAGFIFEDFGTFSTESCDYSDYAHPLAMAVEAGQIGEVGKNRGVDLGIAMCGSGNGIAMTLNKHQRIRAALCWNVEIVQLARAHNNANILVLPARFINKKEVEEMIRVFLSTPFEGDRHQQRIDKIPIIK